MAYMEPLRCSSQKTRVCPSSESFRYLPDVDVCCCHPVKGKKEIPSRPGRSQGYEFHSFHTSFLQCPCSAAYRDPLVKMGAFCPLAVPPPVPRLCYPTGPHLPRGYTPLATTYLGQTSQPPKHQRGAVTSKCIAKNPHS